MAQRQAEPVWKGLKDIVEQPGSPDYTFEDGIQCVRVFEGPVPALESFRPDRWSAMSDLTARDENNRELTVRRSRITPLDAGPKSGHGRLTIHLDTRPGRSSSFADARDVAPEAGDVVEEVVWEPVDKDIRYHPRYLSGGDSELTDTDRQDIEKALNDPGSALPWEAASAPEHLYKRLLRGQDAYTVYVPVVRRTTYIEHGDPGTTTAGNAPERPSGIDPTAGDVEDPPANLAPPGGWVFRKTQDDLRRKGGTGALWERIEEWTGAEEIDEDIYPVPVGGDG